MRLHLHQSQLDFLIKFFGETESSLDQLPSSGKDSVEPRMTLKESTNFGGHEVNAEALLPYFQVISLTHLAHILKKNQKDRKRKFKYYFPNYLERRDIYKEKACTACTIHIQYF